MLIKKVVDGSVHAIGEDQYGFRRGIGQVCGPNISFVVGSLSRVEIFDVPSYVVCYPQSAPLIGCNNL